MFLNDLANEGMRLWRDALDTNGFLEHAEWFFEQRRLVAEEREDCLACFEFSAQLCM